VARGYPPQEGIDCDGTIGLAARYTSIKSTHGSYSKDEMKASPFGCEDGIP
jgi:hypothetical protein